MSNRQLTPEDSAIFCRLIGNKSATTDEYTKNALAIVENFKHDTTDFRVMLERETFEPPGEY